MIIIFLYNQINYKIFINNLNEIIFLTFFVNEIFITNLNMFLQKKKSCFYKKIYKFLK